MRLAGQSRGDRRRRARRCVLGAVTFVPGFGPLAEFDGPTSWARRMLAVHPAAQGRGVGRRLAQVCLDRRGRRALPRSCWTPPGRWPPRTPSTGASASDGRPQPPLHTPGGPRARGLRLRARPLVGGGRVLDDRRRTTAAWSARVDTVSHALDLQQARARGSGRAARGRAQAGTADSPVPCTTSVAARISVSSERGRSPSWSRSWFCAPRRSPRRARCRGGRARELHPHRRGARRRRAHDRAHPGPGDGIDVPPGRGLRCAGRLSAWPTAEGASDRLRRPSTCSREPAEIVQRGTGSRVPAAAPTRATCGARRRRARPCYPPCASSTPTASATRSAAQEPGPSKLVGDSAAPCRAGRSG